MRNLQILTVVMAILLAVPIMGITQSDNETPAGWNQGLNPSLTASVPPVKTKGPVEKVPAMPGGDGHVDLNNQLPDPEKSTYPATSAPADQQNDQKKTAPEVSNQKPVTPLQLSPIATGKSDFKKIPIPISKNPTPKYSGPPQFFSSSHTAIYQELKTWNIASEGYVKDYIKEQLRLFGLATDETYQRKVATGTAAPSGYNPAIYSDSSRIQSDYPVDNGYQPVQKIQYGYNTNSGGITFNAGPIVTIVIVIIFLFWLFRKPKNLKGQVIGFFWNFEQVLMAQSEMNVTVSESALNLSNVKKKRLEANTYGLSSNPLTWISEDKIRVTVSINNFAERQLPTEDLLPLVSRICQQILKNEGIYVPNSGTFSIGKSKETVPIKEDVAKLISEGEIFRIDKIVTVLPEASDKKPGMLNIQLDFQMSKKEISANASENSATVEKTSNFGLPPIDDDEVSEKQSDAQYTIKDGKLVPNPAKDVLPEEKKEEVKPDLTPKTSVPPAPDVLPAENVANDDDLDNAFKNIKLGG